MYLLYTENFFWLTIVNSLLLYTHYSSFFLILTQVIYLAFYNRGRLKQFTVYCLLLLLLYLPWLPQLIRQLNSGINVDTYLPGWHQVLSVSAMKAMPLTFFKLVAGRITFISTLIYLVYIVFVLGVTFFAFRFAKNHRNFLFTWVLLPIFLTILISVVLPQNQPFRVIYILPGLILIFSQVIVRFPKLFLTLFLYIAVVGNLAYFSRPRLQREQWRQALEFVSSSAGTDAPVIVKFPDKFSPMLWYSPNLLVLGAVPTFPAKPDEIARRLTPVSASYPSRVYLFDYLGDLTDPNREVDLTLVNLGYQRLKTYDYPGVGFIHLWQRI
jgi:hypothetical protein